MIFGNRPPGDVVFGEGLMSAILGDWHCAVSIESAKSLAYYHFARNP